MFRSRTLGIVVSLMLVVSAVIAAQGYVVILKSGHKIRCKEAMKIEGPNAILTLATGTVASYPVALIDLVETERYNQLGLGDALMIEELSVQGTPIPTHDLWVAVHVGPAHQTRQAALAGVTTIEHGVRSGNSIDGATLQALADNRVVYVATLGQEPDGHLAIP